MQNNEVWLKLVEQLPQIITSLGVIVVGWFAYKSRQQSVTNAKILTGVEKKVDGMSSDLVAATKDAEFVKGKLDERDAERAHLSESPPDTPIVNGSEEEPLKVKPVRDKKP